MTSSGRDLFWKPGAAPPWREKEEDKEDSVIIDKSLGSLPISQQRARLPIAKHSFEGSMGIDIVENAILYMLESSSTLIIIGETGCGKTTRVEILSALTAQKSHNSCTKAVGQMEVVSLDAPNHEEWLPYLLLPELRKK
jgi:ABC-type glutathione transport system ATPase component